MMSMRAGFLLSVWIAAAAASGFASAQTTTRVSLDSSGVQAGGHSSLPCISADGRYVAFRSYAANLVAGDTNNASDVFLRDTLTGTTTRVGVDPSGAQFPGGGDCIDPAISADGRFVAFIYAEPPLTFDVYRHDRSTGQTVLVSAALGGGPSNGLSSTPAVSGDGRFVAFLSSSGDIVPADTDPNVDCFVRDVQTGTTVLASVNSSGIKGNGHSEYPSRIAISADGDRVVFKSGSTNLVPGDVNHRPDLFLRDLQAGTTTLVSTGMPFGFGLEVTDPAISADGLHVAFDSNFAFDAADTNAVDDVYVRNLSTGTIRRASVSSSGARAGGRSRRASISGDGRFVAFESDATNLFADDTNQASDVLVHDTVTGRTSVVSTDSTNLLGNQRSWTPSISADGVVVAFASLATNLVGGDTNAAFDIFRNDTTCVGAITRYCTAKTNSLGCVPSIGSTGTPSLSGPDDFHVTGTNVRNRKLGLLFWNLAPADVPVAGGTRCVGLPMVSLRSQGSGGSPGVDDCTGSYDFHFAHSDFLQHGLGAGTTVYAQIWSRDPGFAPPNHIGLTDGLRFTICR